MSEHDPLGKSLCIHSVVVAAEHQRQGLATWMVTRYVSRISASHPAISRFLLLAHADKLGLYERCGFTNRGESSVEHGAVRWIEMAR